MSEGPASRDYRVVLGSQYDRLEPHALLMSMHGCGGSHLSTGGYGNQNFESLGIPAITVGPSSAIVDARGNSDAMGTDGSKCWNLNVDWYDINYIEELIEDVLDTYCIDTRNIFFSGGSSGSFAAQGIGCYTQATAITGGRGGIHHPSSNFPDFPETPVPSDAACGPIPVLLGFARQDQAVPYEVFAPPARDFWRRNNGCSATTTRDTVTEARVCHSGVENCVCDRYDDCDEPVVICEWDGGHDATAIGSAVSVWWLSQFLDGGSGTTPNPPPLPDCTPSAQDFIADIQIDPAEFPLSPWCDQCRPSGVVDGDGDTAQFVVRWGGGFDPRTPQDSGNQWIEERPGYVVRPYLRIVGEGTTLTLSSSTDGVTYRADWSGTNPLSGSIDWSAAADSMVVARSLTCG